MVILDQNSTQTVHYSKQPLGLLVFNRMIVINLLNQVLEKKNQIKFELITGRTHPNFD